MNDIPRCITEAIAIPDLNSDLGLRRILQYIHNTVGGSWGRRNDTGIVIPDASLGLDTILTTRPFYGDYRDWWRQGVTDFCSENWDLHIVALDGRKHFVSACRCDGLMFNTLSISTQLDEESVVSKYVDLASGLYALTQPHYLFVDAPENGLDREGYEKKRFPVFWANWYGADLARDVESTFLLNAPVYEAKPLPDGGIYVQTTHSLAEHLRQGWSSELKRYFRGKRVRWGRYEDTTGFFVEEKGGIVRIRPYEQR